ncbi:hypothetical protein L4C34_02930 [Vibrio profundum]|uniref:hypothetical protein n=1 Tax=Vibrio profundum TaxID=2910247 RepID=UPI003D0DF142
MELLGIEDVIADEYLELSRENECLFFEQKANHVLFSVASPIESDLIQKAQMWIMPRLNLERTYGLPIRCFCLRELLVCSVSIPQEKFSGDSLYPLYQYLHRLLNKCVRNN